MARGKAATATPPDELSDNAKRVQEALIESDVIAQLAVTTELGSAQVIDALGELNDYGTAARQARVNIGDEPGIELDEPAEGYGHVIIEAPADVVEAMAALHPSEHASMASMASGRLREALIESGKHRSRRPRGSAPLEAATVAVVAGRLI